VIDLEFLSEIQKLAARSVIVSVHCRAFEIFLNHPAMKKRCSTDTIVSFLTHWRLAAGHHQRKEIRINKRIRREVSEADFICGRSSKVSEFSSHNRFARSSCVAENDRSLRRPKLLLN
jgi:hypothetical protein